MDQGRNRPPKPEKRERTKENKENLAVTSADGDVFALPAPRTPVCGRKAGRANRTLATTPNNNITNNDTNRGELNQLNTEYHLCNFIWCAIDYLYSCLIHFVQNECLCVLGKVLMSQHTLPSSRYCHTAPPALERTAAHKGQSVFAYMCVCLRQVPKRVLTGVRVTVPCAAGSVYHVVTCVCVLCVCRSGQRL